MALSKKLFSLYTEMTQTKLQLTRLKNLVDFKNREIIKKQKMKLDLEFEVKRLKNGAMKKEISGATVATLSAAIDPVSILPIEVWDLISGSLTTSSDMVSMHGTCCMFRSILASRRTTFLFKEVLPLILPHVDTSAALSYRKVCKLWKTDFDSYIGASFTREDLSSVMNEPEMLIASCKCIKSLENSYQFANTSDEYLQPRKFLEMITSHAKYGSPFIGNGLKLVLYTKSDLVFDYRPEFDEPNIEEREEIFWTDLKLLVEKFGQYVLTLQVHVSNDAPVIDAADVCAFLYHDLMRNCSNLNRLLFSGFLVIDPRRYVWNPLYNFPLLHTLQVDIEAVQVHGDILPDQFYAQVRDAVHTRLPSLTSLMLSWRIWEEWGISTLAWSHLQELRLIDVRSENFDVHVIANSHVPNLRELHIEPTIAYRLTAGIPFVVLMSTLACSGSQEFETIKVWNGFKVSELLSDWSTISEIKNVVIQDINGDNECGPGKFNFLLHFVALKTLKILWPVEMDWETEGGDIRAIAQSYFFRLEDIFELNKLIADRRMAYKISIWRLLPNLDTLCIQNDVFTRRRYEIYNNM